MSNDRPRSLAAKARGPRYTKQRGSLLWTTGTTANAGLNRIKWCIFTPASGVLLLRR